ncbi:MAG: hypothetical protein OXL97_03735 [Chloroflexota bacterium]|nr:hypothetical protein [Chloroflexota bacterium]MDE2884147.1 hypothetical protein [Chloroflexota bacterium]
MGVEGFTVPSAHPLKSLVCLFHPIHHRGELPSLFYAERRGSPHCRLGIILPFLALFRCPRTLQEVHQRDVLRLAAEAQRREHPCGPVTVSFGVQAFDVTVPVSELMPEKLIEARSTFPPVPPP